MEKREGSVSMSVTHEMKETFAYHHIPLRLRF